MKKHPFPDYFSASYLIGYIKGSIKSNKWKVVSNERTLKDIDEAIKIWENQGRKFIGRK